MDPCDNNQCVIDAIRRAYRREKGVSAVMESNKLCAAVSDGRMEVVAPAGRAGACLVYAKDAWDTAFFKRAVFKIHFVSAPSVASGQRLLSSLLARAEFRDSYWIYVGGVCTKKVGEILTASGFEKNIEMVDLSCKPHPRGVRSVPPPGDVIVAAWSAGDLKRVEEIAAVSFSSDRFHRDGRLGGNEAADEYHRQWIRNCLLHGIAAEVFVAKFGSEIAGFLACKEESAATGGVVGIVLIAVDAEFRGRGVGNALLRKMTDHFGDKPVIVRTESENLGAVRLYKRYGFKVDGKRTYMALLNSRG